MQQTYVLLLQSDPNVAQSLATSLADSFHGVHTAKSIEEVRHAAAKYQPLAIIVDLETASLNDVELLKRDFQHTRIVCNHRVADEEMWSRSLNAGADDCCPSSDMRAILSATVGDAVAVAQAAA